METVAQEPETLGFLRLKQIVGDKRRGIEPLIPVSASSWWDGCKRGIYPRPLKLSKNTTVWKKSDVLDVIRRVQAGAE